MVASLGPHIFLSREETFLVSGGDTTRRETCYGITRIPSILFIFRPFPIGYAADSLVLILHGNKAASIESF